MENQNEYLSDASVFDSLGKGWSLALANFGPFLGIVLLSVLIGIPANMSNMSEIMPVLGAIFTIISILWSVFISNPINMSINWVFLRATRKEDFSVGDMFAVFSRNYWNAVGAAILTGLATFAGFILLIIPGIIVAIRLSFTPFLVIDKKLGAIDAMKESWEMTKGHSWTIFGFMLMAMLIVIAGMLVFFVGIFFSIMWIGAAFAVLYRGISQLKPKTA